MLAEAATAMPLVTPPRAPESRAIGVVHVLGGLDIGGEQRYVIRLANRLSSRFRQTIVYTHGDALKGEIAPHIECVELVGHRLSVRRPGDWAHLAGFYADIGRLVRDPAVDIVATQVSGVLQVAASLAAHRAGKRVVHTIQRPWGNRAPTEGAVAWNPLVRDAVYRLTDRFVALGSYYAFDQITRFRIPASRIHLNYIGVDLDEYRPQPELRPDVRREFSIAPDAPLLGVVARHNPEKAVGRGLRFFAAFAAEVPAARLLLVGDGPTHEQHVAEIRDLGVQQAVIVAGARPDSARLMNGCDAIMQTTYNPLNGISSIEAMAVGKPVVTVVENPEEEKMAADTCVEGQNGMFLHIGDPVDARRLAALLADPNRLRSFGETSRRLALERFDIRAHVTRTEALYTSLAAERS